VLALALSLAQRHCRELEGHGRLNTSEAAQLNMTPQEEHLNVFRKGITSWNDLPNGVATGHYFLFIGPLVDLGTISNVLGSSVKCRSCDA